MSSTLSCEKEFDHSRLNCPTLFITSIIEGEVFMDRPFNHFKRNMAYYDFKPLDTSMSLTIQF